MADTVTDFDASSWNYSGGVGPSRRWAAVVDSDGGRLLFADTATRLWHDIRAPIGPVEGGIAVTSVHDTALIAWPTSQGMAWATAGGYDWQMGGYIPRRSYSFSPAFRPLLNGDQLLVWGGYGDVLLRSTFHEGQWTPPETLLCAGLQGPLIAYSEGTQLTSALNQPVAVAWDNWSLITGAHLCVCMGTEDGLGQGEELTAAVDPEPPSIARDVNGDVWVAWWRRYEGAFWTHTYTTVTASPPRIGGAPVRRVISWDLSGPAPESWWAVLRSRRGGPFEVAARVRAGTSTQPTWANRMSWIDNSPPGILRYKIRRESVDTRYQWESGETQWPPLGNLKAITLRVESPVRDGASISLSGAAAGPVSLQLYDPQGRAMLQTQANASGIGRDALRLDLGARSRVDPGVYFLRATDSRGVSSNAARIVILH